jgi:hypothetical protein
VPHQLPPVVEGKLGLNRLKTRSVSDENFAREETLFTIPTILHTEVVLQVDPGSERFTAAVAAYMEPV